MIQAIIFDCFGVIVGNAADHALDSLHVEEPLRSKIHELYRQYDSGLIGYDEEHEQIAELLNINREEWEARMKKYATHNQHLLEYIRTLPHKKALLSNIGTESMDRLKSEVDLSCFETIQISGKTGVLKPQAEAFIHTAEALSVDPQDCIFIDDMSTNVEGAEAVGMRGIVYQNFPQLRKELEVLLAE